MKEEAKEVIGYGLDTASRRTIKNVFFLLLFSEIGIAAFTVAYVLNDWSGHFDDLEVRLADVEERVTCLTIHHWTGDDKFEGC